MKSILTLILAFFCLLGSRPADAAEDFTVPAKHAIAVEVSTGKILYEQDATTPASVASISKLLSIYLVYEALEKGEIELTSMVPISDYPYSLTRNPELSNVVLDARLYSVEDLLRASLITSSNSAIIALAEAIAGSEAAFVDRMKTKLADWQITDAHLVNVSGLDNSDLEGNLYPGSSPEDTNFLSAFDVAVIARRLLLDYPQVLDLSAQPAYLFGGETYYATNKMLADGPFARKGVDGLKTGTSVRAGASFVATSLEQGMRIVTVVLHTTDGDVHPENRFIATDSLLNYVYETFTLDSLLTKGDPLSDHRVSIFNGNLDTSPVAPKTEVRVVRCKTTENPFKTSFTPAADSFDAPLPAGQTVGHLTLTDTELIGSGYLEPLAEVEVVLPESIAESSWPWSWWNHFIRYVNQYL